MWSVLQYGSEVGCPQGQFPAQPSLVFTHRHAPPTPPGKPTQSQPALHGGGATTAPQSHVVVVTGAAVVVVPAQFGIVLFAPRTHCVYVH